MGYTTDFVGHLDITPALNDAEVAYLSAYRHTRHFDRLGGPYEVPGNPWADDRAGVDIDAYNRPGPGLPQLWCHWQTCVEGCCLAFSGDEKFYAPVPWLRYLVQHFLKPGATASKGGDDRFQEFSFDHRLDGIIIGCRRDSRELFQVTVKDNRIREKVLRPGDPDVVALPPLPYEVAKDRAQAQLSGRRTRRPVRLSVVPEQRRGG